MKYLGSKSFENQKYKNSLLKIINENIFSSCKSEEDLRKKFEAETNRILRLIGAIPDDEYIEFNSEVTTENGRRIDSKYKNIIIEYKKYRKLDNKTEHDNAVRQLYDYLADSQFQGKSVYGILFDGHTMEFYHKDQNGIYYTPKINGTISIKNLDYYFKITFLRNKKEISSFCLKQDFEIKSKSIKETYRYIFNALMNRTNKRTTLMLNEWKKMFRLSETDTLDGENTHPDIKKRRKVLSELTGIIIDNSEKEYEAIFSLHTLFAIILKILLCKSVNEFKNILDNNIESLCLKGIDEIKQFFVQLENGTLLRDAGLINMLEGDFFSWYIKENLWNEYFINKLKILIETVAEYEEVRIKKYSLMEDLFRELYEAFIPNIIRHCFGEYYTPYWLAENVMLESTNDKKTFCTVLDPCCGSGTFLISAINKRIETIEKNKDINYKIDFNILTKGIYGIDLNPLAVLMARINLFINVAPHITNYNQIEIPIYNGDSTYSPTIEIYDGVKMLSYSLNTTIMGNNTFDIMLPYDFVSSTSFISIIDKLEDYILLKDKKRAYKYLIDEIKNEINLTPKVQKLLFLEIEKLVDLEKQELNGIWLRIFANYLKTGVIPKIDCIIGNPPWIRWNILPYNYRNTVKTKCRLDGLFSDDTNFGGVDLNICALIANKCCEKWLSSNGRLSFLMPQSILFNKSFQGFRNLEIYLDNSKNKCYFESITNWSKSGNPFKEVKELFCTYHITFKKQNYNSGIPEKYYVKTNKNKLRNNSTWHEVENNFSIYEGNLCCFKTKNDNNFTRIKNRNEIQKINKIIGINEYTFRKGVDAQAPMRLTFIRNINDEEAEFFIWSSEKHRLKQTKSTIVLEKKYIKPFITAPMIKKNSLNWNQIYIICPYDDNKTPLSISELKKKAPKTAAYLSKKEHQLSNRSSFNKRIQNNKEYYALLRIGNYSFANNFVVIRDNSKFVSCVVTKIKTGWGEWKTPIFDGHVSYISEREKGTINFISEKEATYINSILNLDICSSYIINSTSLRSIGTRFMIKIPIFQDNKLFNNYLKIHSEDQTSGMITEKAYLDLLSKI